MDLKSSVIKVEKSLLRIFCENSGLVQFYLTITGYESAFAQDKKESEKSNYAVQKIKEKKPRKNPFDPEFLYSHFYLFNFDAKK